MTLHTSRTALVTGASRGLGLALARRLAQDGWNLIIDARGADALEAARVELANHTRLIAIPGDVTDPAHREALVAAAEKLGGLDAVVNNAGILGPSPQPHLMAYPLDILEAVYRANVIAPLAVLQAVADQLKPGVRLINITSDAGAEAYEGWGGYGSSKAALEKISAVLAAENPAWRVYWVDPGDMRTQMHQEAFPGEEISDRPLPEESVPGLLALLEGDLPSGRYLAHELAPIHADTDGSRGGVRELRVALTVDDLERAREFYQDGLGLPVVEEWQAPEGQGLILAAEKATVELVDKAQAEYIDQVEAGRRVADPVRLAFEVSDLKKSAAHLRGRGASALNGPVRTPWGHLNLRLAGPDDIQITLYELQAEEAAQTL